MSLTATEGPIRVMLVDDHTLFRKGLAELLEQGGTIKVAAIAGNGDDALRILQEARPDVIITDLNMPEMSGVAYTVAAGKLLLVDADSRMVIAVL